MNHYFDTSAIVKLYLEERGSDLLREVLAGGDPLVTSALAYVETRAAFARQHREGRLTKADVRGVVEDLEDDWGEWVRLDLTDGVARRGGALAERHALRGADAVHLASAITYGEAATDPVTFWSDDLRLVRAARREGLRIGNLGRAG